METIKGKILVIDDDPDFIEAVTPILSSANYNVITASSPDQGKEKILAEKPDLVLLDIMMDSLFDGFSLCHNIKTAKVTVPQHQNGKRIRFCQRYAYHSHFSRQGNNRLQISIQRG